MNILNITQHDNGIQKMPYADHIWIWTIEIEGNIEQDELLTFCQTFLRRAAREHDEYFKQYRDSKLSFEEHMKIVCGGWYKLEKTSARTYKYTVHKEYID